MKMRHWLVTSIIVFVLGFLAVILRLFMQDPVVLQPSGSIGLAQRDLFYLATAIMSIVVIPVFILLFYIAWKYRATNNKAKYSPHWQSNKRLEAIWWIIPIVIVGVLSVIAFQTSRSLDPFRPITSDLKTEKVEVVALQWKWLFIYPEYGTASVNELLIPVNAPVEFSIAADSPMNSFWIPELGGQIYAMNGMKSKLHLQANRLGEFKGVSSNLSGEGFADMKFTVKSVTSDVYTSSLQQKRADSQPLDMTVYEALAVPSVITEPQWYKLADEELHQKIIHKYMLPAETAPGYDEGMMTSDEEGAR